MAENWIIEQTVELTRPVHPYVGQPVELMLPGDHLAHTLRIKCKERDMPVNLTGYTAAGYFKRTDGNTVLVVGSIIGNVVDVTLSQECYAFPGNLRGVVRITNSTTDAKITLCDRLFHVGQAVDDGGTIDPGEVIPSLDDLLAEIDAMEQATAAAEAAADAVPDMVAPVFSTSTAYSAGSYIYYDGALYRFTADHAAGAWNSAQAVAVTVGGEIADLKSATCVKTLNDYPLNSGSFKSDGTWTNATSANYKHIVIPILPSDKITIVAGERQAVFAIFASYTTPENGAAIPYSSVTGFTNYFTVAAGQSSAKTAPSDAAYLYVSMLSGGNSTAPSHVIINDIDASLTTVENMTSIAKVAVNASSVADENASGLAELKSRTSYNIFADYPTGQGTYNSSGKWTNVSANYMHSVIDVSPGDLISITADAATWYGILASYSTPVANNPIPFSSVTGFTGPISISASATVAFTAPSDAAYLIIGVKSSGNDRTPSVIEINGIDIKNTTLENLKATTAKLETVKATMDAVETGFNVLNASVGFNSLAALPESSGRLQAAGTWTYVNNPNHVSKHVAFPVNSGDTIVFTGTATSAAFLKNYSKPTADGQSVQFSDATGYTGIQSMVDATLVYTYTVPADVHYMYVLTVSEGAARTIGDIVINDASVMMPLAANFKRVFHPEPVVNWCAMGDSITYGYWSEFNEGGGASSHTLNKENIGWAYLVAKENNWALTNIAIGGEGYLDIASGGSGYCGYTQARDTDFSGYNLVTIALGVNDWKANKVMGTMEDDPTAETITAFIPAMRATLEAIMTSNPTCKIIVITPLNCNGYEHTYGSQATNWGMGYAMSNSGTLKQFRDKMIEICELYGVQYIDMSSASCINSFALPTMLPDGVHPAIDTHKLLARELAKKITF